MCAVAVTMGPQRGEERDGRELTQREVSEAVLRRCLRRKAEMEPGWAKPAWRPRGWEGLGQLEDSPQCQLLHWERPPQHGGCKQ